MIRGAIAGYIQTFSGGAINPLDADVEDINIEDIAHALGCQCRFAGHLKSFYSVGQHSVLVSHHCDKRDALWGLLHDATEAYLIDVPRPLKRYGEFGEAYRKTEDRLMRVICERFNLPPAMPPSVHRADDLLLRAEANQLFRTLRPEIWKDWDCSPVEGIKVEPWSPEMAESMFLARYEELTNG